MKAPKSMRVWFAFMGIILCLGIYLTGFSNVNWLMYVPVVGFLFAAGTGICPSQVMIFKMFRIKIKETSDIKVS